MTLFRGQERKVNREAGLGQGYSVHVCTVCIAVADPGGIPGSHGSPLLDSKNYHLYQLSKLQNHPAPTFLVRSSIIASFIPPMRDIYMQVITDRLASLWMDLQVPILYCQWAWPTGKVGVVSGTCGAGRLSLALTCKRVWLPVCPLLGIAKLQQRTRSVQKILSAPRRLVMH